MSEHPPFKQISSTYSEAAGYTKLFALDVNGDVWEHNEDNEWEKLE